MVQTRRSSPRKKGPKAAASTAMPTVAQVDTDKIIQVREYYYQLPGKIDITLMCLLDACSWRTNIGPQKHLSIILNSIP